MVLINPRRKFYPHQRRATAYLSSRKNGGCLFLEMRLGKTLVTIRYLKSLTSENRILIISPYNVMPVWADELTQENILNYSLLDGTRKKRLKLLNENKRWVISNYESAEKLELHLINWQAVVLDESIRIANPRNKISKYLLKNFNHVKTKMVLCGCPNPQEPLQFVNQMIFVDGRFMGQKHYWSFLRKNYINIGYDWAPLPGTWTKIRDYVENNACVITLKGAGMGSEKIYERRYIPMNAEQKKQHKSLIEFMEYEDLELKNSLQLTIALARIAGGFSCINDNELISNGKIKEIIELMKGELQFQKILIWTRFVKEAEYVHKCLGEKNIESVLIHGKIKNRDMYRRRFQNNVGVRAAVITIASSAKGGDWSAASTAIIYSNEYSNDLRKQLENRIIHPEKKQPVLLIDLETKDSIDSDVKDVLNERNFNENWFAKYFRKKYQNAKL